MIEGEHIQGTIIDFAGKVVYFFTGYLEKESPIPVLPRLKKDFKVEFSKGSRIDAMIMAE